MNFYANTSGNSTADGPGRGGAGSLLPFAIAQPFLWFFMFISNLAVLLVYRRSLGFKTLTNYFVYNIAAADLCMSFNMLVQMVFFLWPVLSTSMSLCMLRLELMSFFTTVSLLSGFFATIDRFMVIVVHRYIQIYCYHPTLTMVRMVTVYLGISNSLLNPIIYAWQKREFREGLKRLLGRHTTTGRVHPEGSTRRTSLTDRHS
nr:hypothetical protein BaRGS_032466 [Batillaria attramentaria]